VIGPFATIGAGTTVENAILRNSIVGEGATVRDVLLDGSIVGNSAVVHGSFKQVNVGDSSEVAL
jgi:glucose-1-phosphate thymidylyltransferase